MIKSILLDILSSIKQHKVRSLLTGFGIGWGIFILVILLGVSSGTEKGVSKMFEGFAQNSLWFYGGSVRTDSSKRRAIEFDMETLENVRRIIGDEIIDISPEKTIDNSGNVFFGEKSRRFTIKAVDQTYFDVKLLDVESGRLMNKSDNLETRNVAIVGQRIKKAFFEEENPLGQYIAISDEYYKIIGVLKSGSVFDQGEQGNIFIPFETGVRNFNTGGAFSVFGISFKKGASLKIVEERIKQCLANQCMFDIKEKEALYVVNYKEQTKTFDKLFSGLNLFFGFIGICLLLSGVIGVTNIMFVVVGERTREIGIRKAIGAKPKSIISMILIEAVGITTSSGIVGILLGIMALKLINLYLDSIDIIIKETSVNMSIIFGALVLLIVAGLLAGLIPAANAMKIKPIKAIQTE